MSKAPKRYNGLHRRDVLRGRLKIVREAEKKGYITNARAKKVGKFPQVWFHLQTLADAGVLEHEGYNRWAPVKRRGRPPKQTPYPVGPRR